jgi:SAM-dependent methyltransferase
MRAYAENYDRIAQDHIAHWRKTGDNPFQDAAAVKTAEDATVALIEQYAPTGAMLDVGCAMGDLLTRFPDRSVGCDISEDYLAIARERGLTVVNAYAHDLPFDPDTYDLVTACDVLEHVLDLNASVHEILRVLRPGGVMIVRVPDSEDLTPYLKKSPYEFVHLRCFDESTLRLQFTRIFRCEVLDCPRVGDEIHAVIRKCAAESES